MDKIKIMKLKLGEYRTNCYVLLKEDKALLIDTGFDDNLSIKAIKDTIGIRELLAILYTHNHFDHIGGGHIFDCPQYMHKEDIRTIIEQKVISKTMNLTDIDIPTELIEYSEKRDMKVGIFEFEVFHTPGHTKGGVCLRFGNDLFTGDTLFQGTWGRTDVGGNNEQIRKSLLFLATLPEELIIHPGHGRDSTIGEESKWIMDRFNS